MGSTGYHVQHAYLHRYAGIECIYSGTRKDKFYIDDVQIDHGLPFVELPGQSIPSFSEGKTVYISMNVPVEKKHRPLTLKIM